MGSLLKLCMLGLVLLISQACHTSSSSPSSSTTYPIFGDAPVISSATRVGPAPNNTLHIVFGLQRNQSGLAALFQQVSTPGSSNYQQYPDVPTLASQYGASSAVQRAVLAYMQSQGVTMTVDATGAFADGRATVQVLSQIFNTPFSEYTVTGYGNFIAPSGTPTLPSALQGNVTEVLGLNTEPTGLLSQNTSSAQSSQNSGPGFSADFLPQPPNNPVSQSGVPTVTGTRSGCADALAKGGFTPNQYQAAYGIDTLQSQGYQGQGIYLALAETSSFTQSNIDTFTQCYGIANPAIPQVTTVAGNGVPGQSGEPFLDIEIILAVAPKLSGLYVFQANITSYADWVSVFSAPLNPQNTGGRKINILSSSIGNCERAWTATFVGLLEHLFLTAAAAGIDTFMSAGDSGSSTCYHHDGVTTALSPEYPSASAYVTSVGGTNLALNVANQLLGSAVWNETQPPFSGALSGGGGDASTFVTAPYWQIGTRQGNPMRTTPDIAMLADPQPGYTIYKQNAWNNDGGTSAATPLTAAAVALLQQKAAVQGKILDPSFLWVYRLANSNSYQTTVYDIVLGNNNLFNVGCCTAGPGYDTASGWGSLNFAALATTLLSP